MRAYQCCVAAGTSVVMLALAVAAWPQTQERLQDVAEPSAGVFTQTVSVDVPAFHGVEPRIALSYASSAKNGFPGVGWNLTGIGSVRATKNGRGVPTYTAADVYLLNGMELVPCAQASLSPSCTTGGTHATKEESYQRIRRVGDTWSVWTKDGTRTDYAPVYVVPEGILRWGQSSVTDTHGNQTTYTWACVEGDCYPDTVTFGPFSVRFYREPRGDVWSFATGSVTTLGRTTQRLRSVFVMRGESPIRAYKLSYETSPGTLRSRLIAVQQFGTDVVHAAGLITGGTSFPARTFTYWNDTAIGTLHNWEEGQ